MTSRAVRLAIAVVVPVCFTVSCDTQQGSNNRHTDTLAVSTGDTDEMIFSDSSELTAFRLRQLSRLLSAYIEEHESMPRDLREILPPELSKSDRDEAVRDAWGTPIRIDPVRDPARPLRSAGPDKRWNTPDDLTGG